MTNYPQAIEEKLDFIVEAVLETIDDQYPIREEFVREVFGEALFQHWLTGNDEPPMDEEGFERLMKIAVAKSIFQELQDRGFIDSIEGDNDIEYVFVTAKGKEKINSHVDELFNVNLN